MPSLKHVYSVVRVRVGSIGVMEMHGNNMDALIGILHCICSYHCHGTLYTTILRTRFFCSTQPHVLSSCKMFPSVFDDPDDITKVNSLIDNSFNAGAHTSSRSTKVSRCTGLLTLNLDWMKGLCSNYKCPYLHDWGNP